MVEGVGRLRLGDGAEQLRHLRVSLLLGLHGEGRVPQVGLGLGDEADLEIAGGLLALDVRYPVLDELNGVGAADGAAAGFLGAQLQMVAVGTSPHAALCLLSVYFGGSETASGLILKSATTPPFFPFRLASLCSIVRPGFSACM